MGKGRLDTKLMDKIAKELDKERIAINVKVSKKANKLGISSEAALVLLAKELNIGTAVCQRKLDPTIQAEIRENLPIVFAPSVANTKKKATSAKGRKVSKGPNPLKLAIDYLIEDEQLMSRCKDILLARSHFDRPINQATMVLEDRIRKKSEPSQKLVGENLVGYAFNEDISKTVLQISKNPDEQRGFTRMIRGVVPAFRNVTHHHVTNNFSRNDALRVCAFIDVLLRVVDNSTKVR